MELRPNRLSSPEKTESKPIGETQQKNDITKSSMREVKRQGRKERYEDFGSQVEQARQIFAEFQAKKREVWKNEVERTREHLHQLNGIHTYREDGETLFTYCTGKAARWILNPERTERYFQYQQRGATFNQYTELVEKELIPLKNNIEKEMVDKREAVMLIKADKGSCDIALAEIDKEYSERLSQWDKYSQEKIEKLNEKAEDTKRFAPLYGGGPSFNYAGWALTQQPIFIVNGDRAIQQALERFEFQPLQDPGKGQPGDLVVYYDDKEICYAARIVTAAPAASKHRVEGKWGPDSALVNHEIDAVPSEFQDGRQGPRFVIYHTADPHHGYYQLPNMPNPTLPVQTMKAAQHNQE